MKSACSKFVAHNPSLGFSHNYEFRFQEPEPRLRMTAFADFHHRSITQRDAFWATNLLQADFIFHLATRFCNRTCGKL